MTADGLIRDIYGLLESKVSDPNSDVTSCALVGSCAAGPVQMQATLRNVHGVRTTVVLTVEESDPRFPTS